MDGPAASDTSAGSGAGASTPRSDGGGLSAAKRVVSRPVTLWVTLGLVLAVGVAITLGVARSAQARTVASMKEGLASSVATSACLGAWTGDISTALTFLADVAGIVGGGLSDNRTGLSERALKSFLDLSARTRRDMQLSYAEWVPHADRAAFEARMRARFSATPYPYRVLSGYGVVNYNASLAVVPAPTAAEYVVLTDFIIGDPASVIVNGYSFLGDPIRGPVLRTARARNAVSIGVPVPSLVHGRAIAPVFLPIWSPAADVSPLHPDSTLPLYRPLNESRWAFRGALSSGIFNTIDRCTLNVRGTVAIHDVTGTPLGAALVGETLASTVYGPVTTAAPSIGATQTGELLVQVVSAAGGNVPANASTVAAYSDALAAAHAAAAGAVQSWLYGAGGRVWRLTVAPDVTALQAAISTPFDTGSVLVGCLVSAAVAVMCALGVARLAAALEQVRRERKEAALRDQVQKAREQQVSTALGWRMGG
jgi:hypothetical protein